MQTIDIAGAPVPALLLARARELAERPALVDGATGRTLTYAALADRVEPVAAGLAERGFGRGDVLAINAPNCPGCPVPVLGAPATASWDFEHSAYVLVIDKHGVQRVGIPFEQLTANRLAEDISVLSTES
jgi:acyl-CoA synthetase (AMP-forming)/AMP-acid ligase II